MAIYKVQNVPLVAQPSDGVCWYASAQMVYKWSQASGKTGMKNPADDSGFQSRFATNGDWYCGDNKFMAEKLTMKKFASVSMDYGSLTTFLAAHGPIFTSVQKNWNGHNYSHAVVIVGAADTGVFIHDPMPVNQGSSTWLTWDQINKALAAVAEDADPQFLTAI